MSYTRAAGALPDPLPPPSPNITMTLNSTSTFNSASALHSTSTLASTLSSREQSATRGRGQEGSWIWTGLLAGPVQSSLHPFASVASLPYVLVGIRGLPGEDLLCFCVRVGCGVRV